MLMNNDTMYSISLHDALPISFWFGTWSPLKDPSRFIDTGLGKSATGLIRGVTGDPISKTTQEAKVSRSEEHTSELQSRGHLVCRLLLEKKNSRRKTNKRKSKQ